MKFFVRFTEDTNISQRYTPEAIYNWIEKTRPYLEELQKNNKVTEWGFSSTDRRIVAFFDVNNAAELHEYTELLPLRPITRVESEPLMESGLYADVLGKVKSESINRYKDLPKGTIA
jgi:muconolactone delta-isomerase